MDDESGEFMEIAELTCVERSESKMERPTLGCRREAAVDSRDEVRHNEKTDQLFAVLELT